MSTTTAFTTLTVTFTALDTCCRHYNSLTHYDYCYYSLPSAFAASCYYSLPSAFAAGCYHSLPSAFAAGNTSSMMASSGSEHHGPVLKRKCRNYPDCRRERSQKCQNELCGKCCDRLHPCSPSNHDLRSKPRGTNKPSDSKRFRRDIQAFLSHTVDMMMHWQGFRQHLQQAGFTKQKFTLALLDHFMLGSEDTNGSCLSFRMPPAELDRIEAVVQPVLEQIDTQDLEDAKTLMRHEGEAEQEQEQVSQPELPDAIASDIKMSLSHIENLDERKERILLRMKLYEKLQAPVSETVLADAQQIDGLSKTKISQLVSRQCPLAFKDKAEYVAFCDGLAKVVKDKINQYHAKLINTAASRLSGFEIIISGSAATMYSESLGSKKGRIFDELGKGVSDLDVAIVFKASRDVVDGKALAHAIFFGIRSKSAHFAKIQYAMNQVRKRFDLEGNGFLPYWRDQMEDRTINVTVAYSTLTHASVLSFDRVYSFTWQTHTTPSAYHNPRPLEDLVRPTHSRPQHTTPSAYHNPRPLEDLVRPEAENKLPLNEKAGIRYEVQSHYQRVEPKLFWADNAKHVRELDRNLDMDQVPITFDNMRAWLKARDVLDLFREIKAQPFPWALNRQNPNLHSYGTLARFCSVLSVFKFCGIEVFSSKMIIIRPGKPIKMQNLKFS